MVIIWWLPNLRYVFAYNFYKQWMNPKVIGSYTFKFCNWPVIHCKLCLNVSNAHRNGGKIWRGSKHGECIDHPFWSVSCWFLEIISIQFHTIFQSYSKYLTGLPWIPYYSNIRPGASTFLNIKIHKNT